jgi:hypothetical protein
MSETPQQQPQQVVVVQKRRFGCLSLIGLVVVVIIAIVVIAAIASGGGSSNSITGTTGTKDGKVTYVVTGPAKASMTYTDGGTNTAQDNNAKLPWKKTVPIADTVITYQVSAQNAGGGSITCKILLDGKVVKTNTSKGDYAIVTCDYQPK